MDFDKNTITRIILFCVLDKQGGIETHIKSLANHLKSAGADVTVAAKWVKASVHYESYFKEIGVSLVYPKLSNKVFALGLPSKLAALALNILAELSFRMNLKAGSFDVVSINAKGLFGERLRRYLKPHSGILTYHEHQTLHNLHQIDPKIIAMFNRMSFVTVNSSLDHKKISTLLNQKAKAYILPALTLCEHKALNNTKKIKCDFFRVAFIGNIGAHEKGAHKLLHLWKTKNIKDMLLTFYGQNSETLGNISNLEMVKVAGTFDSKDIASIFANVDLLVHPADNESLGLVLIEAMAFGVPFLATHVGGVIDIAFENSNVLTVKNDIEEIYQGIITMRRRIENGDIDNNALKGQYNAKWSPNALGNQWLERLGL